MTVEKGNTKSHLPSSVHLLSIAISVWNDFPKTTRCVAIRTDDSNSSLDLLTKKLGVEIDTGSNSQRKDTVFISSTTDPTSLNQNLVKLGYKRQSICYLPGRQTGGILAIQSELQEISIWQREVEVQE